jgi:hypothetical protein
MTFTVTGPTATVAGGPYLTAQLGNPPNGTVPAQILNVWPGQPPDLGLGQNGLNPGINFYAASQSPANHAGSFEFVQLVTKRSYSILANAASNNGVPISAGSLGTGLDNWYPYAVTFENHSQALDYPFLQLSLSTGSPIGETVYSFGATMYLMWDPALPGPGQNACAAASNVPDDLGNPNPQPSTCAGSIPVPLGYISWGYTADAINTLNTNAAATANASGTHGLNANGTAWATGWVLLDCSAASPAAPVFQPNSAYLTASYPTWGGTVTNN